MGPDQPPLSSGGPACPFCGSIELELISPWGGQLITSLVRCRACGTDFEAIRDSLAGPCSPAPPGEQA